MSLETKVVLKETTDKTGSVTWCERASGLYFVRAGDSDRGGDRQKVYLPKERGLLLRFNVTPGEALYWTEFRVRRVLKGQKVDRVWLHTSSDGSACGWGKFEIGPVYRVFASSRSGAGLETSLCSPTRAIGLGKSGQDLDMKRVLDSGL